MKNVFDFDTYKNLVNEKVGSVVVSMYKDKNTNKPFFDIQSENDDVLQVAYVIEDTLKMY